MALPASHPSVVLSLHRVTLHQVLMKSYTLPASSLASRTHCHSDGYFRLRRQCGRRRCRGQLGSHVKTEEVTREAQMLLDQIVIGRVLKYSTLQSTLSVAL